MRLAHGYELPRLFEARLNNVYAALKEASGNGIGAVATVAADAWDQLSITAGGVPWRRASYGFLATVRSVAARGLEISDALAILEGDVAALRSGALVSDGGFGSGVTTLMNFHQTKGREADAVLLVYREGDYLADSRDDDPFTKPSRVLYVALTRSRKQVIVILPPEPHPLVAPFAAFER